MRNFVLLKITTLIKTMTTLNRFFLTTLLFIISINIQAQNHFVEDFEDCTSNCASSYYTSFTLVESGSWTALSAGNFTLGPIFNSGSKALTINDDTNGAHATTASLNTVGTVSFYYHCRSGAAGNQFQLQKSVSGGAFTTINTHTYGDAPSSYNFYSFDVNDGNSDVKIRILNDNQSGHLLIDDMTISQFTSSPPVINSSLSDNATCNTAYSYFITASNSPTSYNASGLPSGLSINTSTGEISGTPSVTGTFNINISATNGAGTDNETLVLNIASSTPTVSFQVNGATVSENGVSYTIQVDGSDCSGTANYSVDISVSGGTAPPSDYSFTSPTTLSFTGTETQTAIVTINDNALIDGNRTLSFSLGNTSGCILGGTSSFNLIIEDDEVPPFTYLSGDWRTKVATGLSFNGTANWESFDGSTWTAESLAPQNCACSPGRIIIEHETNGGGSSTNTYNSDFIIKSGGILNIVDDNGSPVNFIASGKFITVLDGGLLNISGDIQIPSGASLIVESGGKISINQNTVSLNHPIYGGTEDFQEGSIFEILEYDWTSSNLNRRLLDLNATYTISQNTSGQGYYFGNVIIDVNPTNNFTLFGGNTSVNIIQNDLTVSNASATQPILVSGNANGPEITFGGNININSGVFSFGTQFGGGSSTQTIHVKGNLNTNGTVSLRELNSGTSVSTVVNVEGNIDVLGGTFQTADDTSLNGSATLVFSGSNAQTFTNNGTCDLHLVHFNKSAENLSLNSDLQVKTALNMIAGNCITHSNMLILGETTANPGTLMHSDGFVVGIMRRYFNTTTTSGIATALFPIGTPSNQNRFAFIEYGVAPSVGGHLTTQFIYTPMGIQGLTIPMANCGGCGFDVEETSEQGYWQIDNNGISGGSYESTLHGEGLGGITDLNLLTIVKRPVPANDWTAPGNHLATTGTIAHPILSRDGLSTFSDFGFGGGIPNPLPVELLYFTAKPLNNKEISLYWATETEINNSHFEIQKSKDGRNFETIGTVKGQGNIIETTEYNFIDNQAFPGISYYRLLQVDFDDTKDYSDIISVELASQEIQVFPTIFNNEIHIIGIHNNEKAIIYSIDGKQIQSFNNLENTLSLNHLPKGKYVLNLLDINNQLLKSFKIIKK